MSLPLDHFTSRGLEGDPSRVKKNRNEKDAESKLKSMTVICIWIETQKDSRFQHFWRFFFQPGNKKSLYEGVADKVVTACGSTISKSLKMLENQGFFDIHSKISQRPEKIFQKFQKILRDHGLKRSFLVLSLFKKYKRKFVHTFLTTTQCLSAGFHWNQECFGFYKSIFHIFIFCKWKCNFWTFQNLSFSEHQTLFPNSKNSWTYSTLRQPIGYQNFPSLSRRT